MVLLNRQLRRVGFGLWLALVAAAASAHEMGAIKITASFSADGHYQLEALADADHAAAALLQRSELGLLFDGEELASPEGAAAITTLPTGKTRLLLEGAVPPGARGFRFYHRSVQGQYLFGSRSEGDPEPAWQWLEGSAPSEPVLLRHAPPLPTRWQVVATYLPLGFTHILPGGLDHILFVLGLCLLSLRRRAILWQITAFTVAHSLTLGLSIYGVVALSPRLVEPLIALSIVYVAIENLYHHEAGASRLAVVFGFGLLHGLGFAGVLQELGLPRSEFLTALLAFNLGVEAGQLTVVTLAFLAVGLHFGQKAWYRGRIAAPASALIAAIGLYWAIERIWL